MWGRSRSVFYKRRGAVGVQDVGEEKDGGARRSCVSHERPKNAGSVSWMVPSPPCSANL